MLLEQRIIIKTTTILDHNNNNHILLEMSHSNFSLFLFSIYFLRLADTDTNTDSGQKSAGKIEDRDISFHLNQRIAKDPWYISLFIYFLRKFSRKASSRRLDSTQLNFPLQLSAPRPSLPPSFSLSLPYSIYLFHMDGADARCCLQRAWRAHRP